MRTGMATGLTEDSSDNCVVASIPDKEAAAEAAASNDGDEVEEEEDDDDDDDDDDGSGGGGGGGNNDNDDCADVSRTITGLAMAMRLLLGESSSDAEGARWLLRLLN